ncbi:MAG TPA: zinc ribbon domain-containing protein [Peptococcaceae bacterium]|jgi:putative FmdB family regulatory protein|nr:zinc ribbon domain-containing protein [Clostridia bacterium]HOB81541.1 zinc ribbon domain-containing protein [Peptococcaceae bacterium]HPZ72081.1 zinc ribbon domain-containing protein [Peptococcaceae bacterium]HQD53629.1 zinc ribbon domain-containing protein [Peptococcaceae bacterium]
MPSYDYRCPKCGKFTISQRITEKALTECPTCGSPVNRLIGKNINVVYKCSGFYCTDHHSPSGTKQVKDEPKCEAHCPAKGECHAEATDKSSRTA